MAEIFEIKARIASLAKINDITYAMQIVTISRLRKLITSTNRLKDTLLQIKLCLRDLCANYPELKANICSAEIKNLKKAPYLVFFFSNRGFCGNFNQSILEKGIEFCQKNNLDFQKTDKLFVGKKSLLYSEINGIKTKITNVSFFKPEKDILSTSEISDLYKIISAKKSQNIPITFICTNFKSIVNQTFINKNYFPINKENFQEELNVSTDKTPPPVFPFMEPNINQVSTNCINYYFYLKLVQTLTDSSCAEFSQRFTIMKNAVDNIKELRETLTLGLNKERQRIITQELTEIISTFKALKKRS
jgi:F-type H+-transporting ATPase subunit gamma